MQAGLHVQCKYCKYTDECAHMHTCVHLCVMHFRMILLRCQKSCRGSVPVVRLRKNLSAETNYHRQRVIWNVKKCSIVPLKVVQNDKSVWSGISLGPRRCSFICLPYLQFFENTIFPFLASTAELIGEQFYNRQCAANSSKDRESSCLYMMYLVTHCQTAGYLAALMVLLETDYKRADLVLLETDYKRADLADSRLPEGWHSWK